MLCYVFVLAYVVCMKLVKNKNYDFHNFCMVQTNSKKIFLSVLYHFVFVRPFLYITNINKYDLFDQLNKGIAWASQWLSKWISVSQNGSLRWYVAGPES